MDHVVKKGVDDLSLMTDKESKACTKWLNDEAFKRGISTYELAQELLIRLYVKKPL